MLTRPPRPSPSLLLLPPSPTPGWWPATRTRAPSCCRAPAATACLVSSPAGEGPQRSRHTGGRKAQLFLAPVPLAHSSFLREPGGGPAPGWACVRMRRPPRALPSTREGGCLLGGERMCLVRGIGAGAYPLHALHLLLPSIALAGSLVRSFVCTPPSLRPCPRPGLFPYAAAPPIVAPQSHGPRPSTLPPPCTQAWWASSPTTRPSSGTCA